MKVLKDKRGNSIVEATIVFPVIIMIILVLFYVTLVLCQRAILQSNLQTSLIYYKNQVSDTNVVINPDGVHNAMDIHANAFEDQGYNFPYRNIFMTTVEDQGSFVNFFNNIAGPMFFKSVSSINVTYDVKNYVVYQSLTATAEQKVTMPVRFEILGIDPTLNINVEARTVINDPDEFVRTSQLVGDLVSETKLGEKLSEMTDKVAAGYEKIKEVLHITDE